MSSSVSSAGDDLVSAALDPYYRFLEHNRDALLRGDPAVVEAKRRLQQDQLARHPESAEELRRHFENVERSGAFFEAAVAVQTRPLPSDRYEIVSQIGSGGQGVVLLARDRRVNRRYVAYKILHGQDKDDSLRYRSLIEEARRTAELDHPNILPIHDAGISSDGRPFFVMPLAGTVDAKGGVTQFPRLSDLLHSSDDRPRPSRRALLGYFRTICDAVAHAHSLSGPLIHRDLKTSNIVVGPNHRVYVLDWGLAVAAGTSPGGRVGTAAYAPPEQARQEPADTRADVFGLGAILSEILTGFAPFRHQANDPAELCWWRSSRDDLTLAQRRLRESGADPGLIAIALKMIAADPQERFPNAVAVREALDHHERDLAQTQKKAEMARRRRPYLVAAVALMLVSMGAFGLYGMQRARNLERVATSNGQVQEILAEGKSTHDQAAKLRQKGQLDAALRILTELKAKIQGAKIAQDDLPEPLRKEFDSLLRRTDEEAIGNQERMARAARQQTLVWKLREASALAGADFVGFGIENEAAHKAFVAAVTAYRDDFLQLTDENAATELKALPNGLRDEVVVGLHHWALLKPPQRECLESIIELADENAWRKQFRAAASLVASDRLVELMAGWKEQPPTAIRLLAVALRRRGHFNEAVSLLQEAVRAYPRDFALNLELAHALGDVFPPRTQERRVAYETATRLNPDSSAAWAGLGDLMAASGRFKEADRCFDLARERTADVATIDLARLGRRVFRGERASNDELRSLHEKYPSRTDVQATLGINLLFATRSSQEGRDHLKAARKLQPKLVGQGDAIVHLLEGRPAGYLAEMKRLRATWPSDLTLVQSEALGLVMCGFFEEAEALTRRALDKGEVPAAVGKMLYALQGWAQQWQGDLFASELSLRAGLNLAPDYGVSPSTDDTLRFLLIKTLMNRGSFEEAERQMKQLRSEGNTLFKAAVGHMFFAYKVSTFVKADAALREMDPKKADSSALAILHEAALARGQFGMAYKRHKEVFASPFSFGLMEGRSSALWHDELCSLTGRVNAARAALLSLASAEQLEGMIHSPKDPAVALRNEARTWLAVELTRWTQEAKSPGSRPKVNAILGYFQRCPDFAIVRDPVRLARLDEKEREAWGKFWLEVTALRQQVQKELRETNP